MSECGLCEACVDVCLLGIIKKKGYKMVIREGCDDCGECLKICPIGCIIPDKEE